MPTFSKEYYPEVTYNPEVTYKQEYYPEAKEYYPEVTYKLSYTYKQLSSPCYQTEWKFSWYVCGYTSVHPRFFKKPMNCVFGAGNTLFCKILNCTCIYFAKCSLCTYCTASVTFLLNLIYIIHTYLKVCMYKCKRF